MDNIHFFAGSSIGALFAPIFALRIDPHAIDRLMMELDFEQLIDMKGIWVRKVMKGLVNWGVDDGNKVDHLLKIQGRSLKDDFQRVARPDRECYDDKWHELEPQARKDILIHTHT
jgi:predicted acylesterase/phospholipase RssA